MTKPDTKKSPTSSSGKSTDVRPQVDTPKRPGRSVPAQPMAPEGIVASLAPMQRMGVETLCRRTGLEQHEVVRLLVSAGLFVVGLDLPGQCAFEFLLAAAVGEERFKEATVDGADVNGLQLAQLAADREAEERLEARPYLAKPAPAQAEA